eukprot:6479787-Amphidinium_carterae.1
MVLSVTTTTILTSLSLYILHQFDVGADWDASSVSQFIEFCSSLMTSWTTTAPSSISSSSSTSLSGNVAAGSLATCSPDQCVMNLHGYTEVAYSYYYWGSPWLTWALTLRRGLWCLAGLCGIALVRRAVAWTCSWCWR